MAGGGRVSSHRGAVFSPRRTLARGITVRALIVDDEPLARRGVLLRLRRFKDVEIIGECGDGASAVEKIMNLSPDVVFLDVQMPGMDGFDVLRVLPMEKLPA